MEGLAAVASAFRAAGGGVALIMLPLLLTIAVGVASPVARAAIGTELFTVAGDHTPVQLTGRSTAAERFTAEVDFDGVDVCCPSWGNNIGNLTLKVYRWSTDFATSVLSPAIGEQTFVNYLDNALLKLTFPEQPAGEYLWVLSNPTESVGVWKQPKSTHPATAFQNGKETKGDYESRVFYTSIPPSVKAAAAATEAAAAAEAALGAQSATGAAAGAVAAATAAPSGSGIAAPATPTLSTGTLRDTFSDTWTATDALGRALPTHEQVGGPRAGKYVGLFYWTWNYNWADDTEPRNVTEILTEHPEALTDLDNPAWGAIGSPHWWSEPLFGYYRSTDPWVLRKHAEMLANAGVDVIFFDCTNGSFTWKPAYMELCKVFAEARQEGVKTPQIAFMLGFGATAEALTTMEELYTDLYKPGLYRDLWFNWKGKPLIMGYPDRLNAATGTASVDQMHKEMRDFFTFRPGQPTYSGGPSRYDQWGWLEIYPQNGYAPTSTGGYEQVTVGVSQNWSKAKGLTAMNAPNTFGRSYSNAAGQDPRPDAAKYGLNFQEQWNRALALDPEFVFITGWNEWIAGRFAEWQGQPNAFPDEFSPDKSRDIEPMKGGFGDDYYYQMVANIRRFKGVRPTPVASAPVAGGMAMDGAAAKWASVQPEFRSQAGDTVHRDMDGWLGTHYTNTTGRNDITLAKVAYDADNLYFYVEAADALTDRSDPAWMRLFIDTDRNRATGWEGYDFVVNRVSPGAQAVLEQSTGGWNWIEVGKLDYAVSGNHLELRIPRALLGSRGQGGEGVVPGASQGQGLADGAALNFEFKWSDNMQQQGDIMDFYSNGDVAPAGRFNYNFVEPVAK